MLIEIDELAKEFGATTALHPVRLTIPSGALVALLGPSGSGKTTLLRCLSGVQPVSGGAITFRGESFTTVPAWKRLGHGLAQSPEGRQIFTNLSVEENLRLGAFLFADARVDRDMETAFAMFPILKEKRNLTAGGLSGGQQQMLAIARALMGRLEAEARARGRSLLTLDTRTGDMAEPLYLSLGFQPAGVIPGYCRDAGSSRMDATTIMWKTLDTPS